MSTKPFFCPARQAPIFYLETLPLDRIMVAISSVPFSSAVSMPDQAAPVAFVEFVRRKTANGAFDGHAYEAVRVLTDYEVEQLSRRYK